MIGNYFKVTGKTRSGTFLDGSPNVFDYINAHGFVDTGVSWWDDQLPYGLFTYSVTDTFVGADMSRHFLGDLLRADANLVYQSRSRTSGEMRLTIDDFEVYYTDPDNNSIWRKQNGSITYRLDCEVNYCSTNDGSTVELWFGSNGQYVGGYVEDIDNEYVGSFVAERPTSWGFYD